MWIFEFSLGVCSMKLRSLVSTLEYLVSNGRQVHLGDIGLGGSATFPMQKKEIMLVAAKINFISNDLDILNRQNHKNILQ